MTVCIK